MHAHDEQRAHDDSGRARAARDRRSPRRRLPVHLLGPKSSPCVIVRWLAGAIQTKVNGVPVLLQTSVGICYSAEQVPQGVAIVAQTQPLAQGL